MIKRYLHLSKETDKSTSKGFLKATVYARPLHKVEGGTGIAIIPRVGYC